MNVSDGERDLAAQLLLVELHAHDLVGEALVEESVDLRSPGELSDRDVLPGRAPDPPVKVRRELLNLEDEGEIGAA